MGDASHPAGTSGPPGHRCGHVAIVGRPNVGKSTLLNRLVAQKISITAANPQTTRHRILGIKSRADAQVLYVDTPGMHLGRSRAINRYLNRAAEGALADVDAVVAVVAAPAWREEDEHVARRLAALPSPPLVAVNKVDRIKDKGQLLPYLARLAEFYPDAELVPVSARHGTGVEALEELVIQRLPELPPLFPADQITDRTERFIAAELIREKLVRRLGAEVPHRLAVSIEHYQESPTMVEIHALIWVERAGQKRIVVGQGGQVLKTAGSEARVELEAMLERKVLLKTWVKVRSNWSDDDRALQTFGYSDR